MTTRKELIRAVGTRYRATPRGEKHKTLDDFERRVVSIAWAIAQYKVDGFNAGGSRPRHEVFGDWLGGDASVKGCALGIENRASGQFVNRMRDLLHGAPGRSKVEATIANYMLRTDYEISD